MGPDFSSNLRVQYAAMADEALIELAGDAHDQLVPVAREVLKAELMSRQLAPEVLDALRAQIDGAGCDEPEALVERAQRLPCPHCGATRTLLNGLAKPQRGTFVGRMLFSRAVFGRAAGALAPPEDPLVAIGCQPCLQRLGASWSWPLKPDQPWPPIPQFSAWVRRNGELLRRFESSADAIAALLRLDGEAFLRITGSRLSP